MLRVPHHREKGPGVADAFRVNWEHDPSVESQSRAAERVPRLSHWHSPPSSIPIFDRGHFPPKQQGVSFQPFCFRNGQTCSQNSQLFYGWLINPAENVRIRSEERKESRSIPSTLKHDPLTTISISNPMDFGSLHYKLYIPLRRICGIHGLLAFHIERGKHELLFAHIINVSIKFLKWIWNEL